MSKVVTTCAKCNAQYSWNSDFQYMPDCPNCGYNSMKINQRKREICASFAETGDLKAVKNCLSDSNVKKNLNAGPLTILYHAVMGNQVNVVKYLLKLGAKPDRAYPQTDNETPLHIAASKGHLEIAQFLIDNGAKIDAKNSNGEKPIDKANDDAMISLLKPYDDEKSMVIEYFVAVKNGDIDKVESFLKGGLSPNLKDPGLDHLGNVSDRLALSYAMENRENGKQLAEVLIKYGADVNVLHYVTMYNRADIIELLIEHGANINTQNNYEQTPLHIACEEGYIDVVKVLLKDKKLLLKDTTNLKINMPDDEGNTPFMLAIYSPYSDFTIFQILIDAGARIREQDLPHEWIIETESIRNPKMLKFLKSYKNGIGLIKEDIKDTENCKAPCKVPCKSCGSMILYTTAKRNNKKCMKCKKGSGCLVIVLLGFVLGFILWFFTTSKGDFWNIVKCEDVIEQYKKYLLDFPNGKYQLEAENKKEYKRQQKIIEKKQVENRKRQQKIIEKKQAENRKRLQKIMKKHQAENRKKYLINSKIIPIESGYIVINSNGEECLYGQKAFEKKFGKYTGKDIKK